MRPALPAHGRPGFGRGQLDRHDRADGQGLVEFAIVLPIVIVLAVACVDLGRFVLATNTLNEAAEAAVRVAEVSQIDPATEPYRCEANHPVEDVAAPWWTFRGCAVAAGASIGLLPADVAVAYAAPEGTSLDCSSRIEVGCIATVTVKHVFVPITPIIGAAFGPTSIEASATTSVERVFP